MIRIRSRSLSLSLPFSISTLALAVTASPCPAIALRRRCRLQGRRRRPGEVAGDEDHGRRPGGSGREAFPLVGSLRVDGPRLKILCDRHLGWVRADEVVPIEKAVEQVNGRLRDNPKDPDALAYPRQSLVDPLHQPRGPRRGHPP